MFYTHLSTGARSRDAMAPALLPILVTLIFYTGIPAQSQESDPAANLISVCPPFNSSVCPNIKPARPECYSDSQCTDSKKCCCTPNCGLQCMVPEKVKDGQCRNIMARCIMPFTYNCTSDSDCIGSKKCCPLCGTKCLDPEPVTLMNCPKNEVDPSDSIQCSSVHCTRDADCEPQEKCCASGNGRSCVNLKKV